MRLLRNLTVRRKLGVILVATGGAALLVACLALLVYDQRSYREVVQRNLAAHAEIVGNQNAVHLALYAVAAEEAAAGAQQSLMTLRGLRHLTSARLVLTDGQVLAAYPEGAPAKEQAAARPEQSLTYVDRSGIHAVYAVREKGQLLGYVELESSLAELRARLGQYLGVVALVAAAAAATALLLFSWLHQALTAPVLHLADVAKRVAARKDYGVRAVKGGQDEFGVLVDCFNES